MAAVSSVAALPGPRRLRATAAEPPRSPGPRAYGLGPLGDSDGHGCIPLNSLVWFVPEVNEPARPTAARPGAGRARCGQNDGPDRRGIRAMQLPRTVLPGSATAGPG